LSHKCTSITAAIAGSVLAVVVVLAIIIILISGCVFLLTKKKGWRKYMYKRTGKGREDKRVQSDEAEEGEDDDETDGTHHPPTHPSEEKVQLLRQRTSRGAK
jgi:FtsZ-interacting cell division protein ZipA